MFDALAHGLRFVAPKLSFFKEFAAHNLDILARNRDSKKFSTALEMLDRNYSVYKQAAENFKEKLDWVLLLKNMARSI